MDEGRSLARPARQPRAAAPKSLSPMAFRRPLGQGCRVCLASTQSTSRHTLAPPRARPFASSSRRPSEPDLISPSSSDRPSAPPRPRASPSPHLKDLQASAHARLAAARANAQQQLRTLLRSVDAGARKQAHAFAAALQALELERKVREVGGRINQATGYEEIERLRNGVGAKGASASLLLSALPLWLQS